MPIKLLIVDDSALVRSVLTSIFKAEGDFEICLARNGEEAVEQNLSFQPDVITLDIHMPVIDGLTALAMIMATRPVPVVMVSSLTTEGALATLEALALGAVDFVAKPDGTVSRSLRVVQRELVAKVRAAVGARVIFRGKTKGVSPGKSHSRRRPHGLRQEEQARVGGREFGLVLIGVSTGGPSVLEAILPKLPGDFPLPVIVAQHMPAFMTKPFAERLDSMCAVQVVEVSSPMSLCAGTVYIGKGDADIVLVQRGGVLKVTSKPPSPSHLWHPSVEILGRSALEHCDPRRLIAIMLTGMGYDGAEAFAEIKRRGGRTIAQSEDSSVVFGMPKELIERGGATVVLPPSGIVKQLIRWSRKIGADNYAAGQRAAIGA